MLVPGLTANTPLHDNEKTRQSVCGPVSIQEKVSITPVGQREGSEANQRPRHFGSPDGSLPFWLKAEQQESLRFSPTHLPEIEGNAYQSQKVVRAPPHQCDV